MVGLRNSMAAVLHETTGITDCYLALGGEKGLKSAQTEEIWQETAT